MNNKTLKYALFLLVLGIIAGGLLALVNSFTAPVIEGRKRQAVKELLGEYFDYARFDKAPLSLYPEKDSTIKDSTIEAIYFAFDDEEDKVAAAVIFQVSAKGYGGPVVTLVGIKVDGTFDDAVVVEAKNETPGYGSKAIGFDFDVKNKSVDVKAFKTITGATYTSNAVHKGILAAAAHFKTIRNTLGGIKNE